MIFKDDEIIKIDGIMLPAIITSLEVKNAALIEEQNVEGSAVKPKQAVGFEDIKITVSLTIGSSENKSYLDKVKIIQNMFKKSGQMKPIVHELICNHAQFRGVTKVLFKEFDTKESADTKDTITASLTFWEYVPVTIKATQNNANSSISNVKTGNDRFDDYLKDFRGAAPSKSGAIGNTGGLATRFIDKTTKTVATLKSHDDAKIKRMLKSLNHGKM